MPVGLSAWSAGPSLEQLNAIADADVGPPVLPAIPPDGKSNFICSMLGQGTAESVTSAQGVGPQCTASPPSHQFATAQSPHHVKCQWQCSVHCDSDTASGLQLGRSLFYT